MDGNQDLIANLKTTKSEVVVAQKLAEKSVGLLRKVEKENEVSLAEARRLVEEKVVLAADKKKAEEEVVWLRQELQDLQAGFAAQKENLEADYQKQVDDMFFYDY